MKRYRQIVEAAKIVAVNYSPAHDGLTLRTGEDPLDFVEVARDWVRRHAPRGDFRALVGGYIVSCSDGASWSASEAFEEDYTPVED